MIWVGAHISPAVAQWISTELGYPASSVRELGLRNAKDKDIFTAARTANAVVITKDADFVEKVERLGSPPSIIWRYAEKPGNRFRFRCTRAYPAEAGVNGRR
jgi:predicted nuclease of predicted toxin-antitoxin system